MVSYCEFSVWFSSNFVATWFTVAPLCECEIVLFHAALPNVISMFYHRVPLSPNLLLLFIFGYTSCWISILWYHQYYWEPYYDFYLVLAVNWAGPEMVSLVDMPLCKYSILQHQAIEIMHLVSEVFCSCSHQPWLIFLSFLLFFLSTPTLDLFYIQNTLDIGIISA